MPGTQVCATVYGTIVEPVLMGLASVPMNEREVPARIAEYFRKCVPDPPSTPRGTRLEQVGEMRLAPERPWMPFTAEQTLSAEVPEFVWRARFKMAPLVSGIVEDSYSDGRGKLDVRLWGWIGVAHAQGPHVDRSEAQRYLAELAWCPMALVQNPYLRFESLTENVVRIWVGDKKTYVDWLFDAHGALTGVKTTTRSRGDVVQPWEGRFHAFKDFEGIRAPSKAEVWWDGPEGRFVYWRGEVTSLRWAESESGE